jgi:hypothetical protein
MAKQRQQDDMVMGFAWFDKAQWQRLREVAGDPEILDDSFEEWERNALRALRDLRRKGQPVQKVNINVDELVSWCKSKGVPVTSKHRAEYVIALLKQRHGRGEA